MEKTLQKKLVLGSLSPRRKEILSYFHYPFRVCASPFDEESLQAQFEGEELARKLAQEKAQAFTLESNETLLTADTVVFLDGKTLNKPKNREESFNFLRALSGNWHTVYTGVCTRNNGDLFTDCCATNVRFMPLSDRQISLYINAFHLGDKAGGYAIQQGGSIVIDRIEGCYYNVMGLPIQTTIQLLEKVGINLWHSLEPH